MTSREREDGRPTWVADEIDLDRPNPARMYDYYLGGAHHFAADRELADQALAVMPWMREAVRANRGFLRRAVTACAHEGIDQFLDLGSGIPTAGATHQVAQGVLPSARVIYVDNDPVAFSHTRLLLAEEPDAQVVDADMTVPADVLSHPAVSGGLDLSRPVAVLALAVLHFVEELDRATAILDAYAAAMAPGSALLFSHVTADHDPGQAADAVSVYRRSSSPVHTRPHAELTTMLRAFDLDEPGLVDATRWRPDPGGTGSSEHAGFYAALARVRRGPAQS